MAKVDLYTRQVMLDRVNTQNIDLVGAPARAKASELLDRSYQAKAAASTFMGVSDQIQKQKQAEAQTRAAERLNALERETIEQWQKTKQERLANPDGTSKTFDDWFTQRAKEVEEEASQNDDQIDLDYFRRGADDMRTGMYGKTQGWENETRVSNVMVGTEQNIDHMNANFALSNPSMGDFSGHVSKIRNYVNETGAKVFGPAENYKLAAYGVDGAAKAIIDTQMQTNPRALKAVLSYGQGTPDQLIEMTMFDIEGGEKIAAEPGGGVAKFGISSDIPGERRSGLTEAQVRALTPETAKEWYKKHWDPRLNQMEPTFRAVAHDALVNHGDDPNTWKMINEAKGDPYALIQIRRQYYAQLIAGNPNKYAQYQRGWENRMAQMTSYVQTIDQGGKDFLQHASLVNPEIIVRAQSQLPDAIAAYDRQAEALQRQKLTDFNTAFKGVYDVVTKNLEPAGQEEINQVKQLAAESGDEEAMQKAAALDNLRIYTTNLKGLGEDQLRAVVRQASAAENQNPGPETRLAREIAEGVLKNQVEAVQKEGIAYWGRIGQVRMPQPVNYANTASAIQELRAREDAAAQIAGRTGKELPVLTPDEISTLREDFQTLPANEMAGTLAAFDQLDPTTKSTLAKAVDDKSPVLATAISVDDLETRRRILQGSKIEGKYKKEDMAATVLETLDPMIADPEFKQKAVAAVSAWYNARSQEERDFSAEITSDRVMEGIKALYGPVVDLSFIGTNNVFSFKDPDTGDFVSDDDLYNLFHGMTDDDLEKVLGKKPTGAMGETVNVDDIKESGRIVSAGDGLYNIVFDGIGGLYDPEAGRLYELDGRKLLQLKRARSKDIKTSDLVMGAGM